MRIVTYITLSLVLSLAVGCAGKRGTGGSWVGNLPEDNTVQLIAQDATEQLAELYAPGHTSLYLLTPEESKNTFSHVFEESLRKKGFTLRAVENPQAVKLAYILDKIKPEEKEDPDSWYLQLRLWDNEGVIHSYARSYAASGTIEAGRTLTTLNTHMSLGEKIKKKAKKAYEDKKESTFRFFGLERGRSKQ